MINGSPKGFFSAERGLRQEDPLSSFSNFLSWLKSAGGGVGVNVARNTPSIKHLQFADETLIFCGENEEQIKNVKATLLFFEVVSGLKVNFKSELNGIRTEKSKLLKYAKIFGCRVRDLPVSYLGLPLCLGSITKSMWNLVVERVERKLLAWKASYLSIGGKRSPLSNQFCQSCQFISSPS